jgi:hypothetical protein
MARAYACCQVGETSARSDGTISVTSEPHDGSSFVVSMPLAHPVAA